MSPFFKSFFKFLIFPIIGILIFIASYFILDPYRLFGPYDSYSHTMVNRDYAGIEMLKKKYSKYKYDSFMFGSSRALAFESETWKKYLKEGSQPYSLDAFFENIYGIYHKIKYLNSCDIPISNAIILVDPDFTFAQEYPRRGNINLYKHPDIDGSSWSEFYRDHFMAYLCEPNILLSYVLYTYLDQKNSYVYKYLGTTKQTIDSISNDLRLDWIEEEIENGIYYENANFEARGDSIITKPPMITKKHKQWLTEIKAIFDKQKTDYKIIISPLYTYEVLSDKDLKILIDIFGENAIYNFSGINEFTKNQKNYYEIVHYRPHVGDSIFEYIYVTSKLNNDSIY